MITFSANNPETLVYALYGALHADRTTLEFSWIKMIDGIEVFKPGNHFDDCRDDDNVFEMVVYEFADGDSTMREPTEGELAVIKNYWSIVEPLCFNSGDNFTREI